MKKLSFILLFSIFCFSCGNNNKSPKPNEKSVSDSVQNTSQSAELENSDEPELLTAGRELQLNSEHGGDMRFLFKEINVIPLPNGAYNLVLQIQFKNNMKDNFMISDAGWRLTDTNMIEVKESGVYSFDFNDFTPAMFFFTTVDAGFGKVEEVGYQVTKGTYYLHIAGMNVAKIVI